MGLFQHGIRLFDPRGERSQVIDAWVDSGSTYTWIPRSVLTSLGVQPTGRRTFVLADGSRVEQEVAQVRIQLAGDPFFTYCVFAKEGTEPLLGAVALEEAGLAVDPVNKRLIPTFGYALGAR